MTPAQKAFILELADLLEKHQAGVHLSQRGEIELFVNQEIHTVPTGLHWLNYAYVSDLRKLVEQ